MHTMNELSTEAALQSDWLFFSCWTNDDDEEQSVKCWKENRALKPENSADIVFNGLL